MGVVFQVEGGGQCPGQVTGTLRLRLVSACAEADLFQQGNGVSVILSSRPFAQQPAAQGVTGRDRGQDRVAGRDVIEVKVLRLVGIAADQFGDFQVRAGVRRAGASILGGPSCWCLAFPGGRGRSRLSQKLADVGAGQADGVLAPLTNDWLACARQSP